MAVRSSMYNLIALVRKMIFDPFSDSTYFSDEDIQERLDANRDDVRYEGLTIAPSIVNIGGNQNSASTIFADYYSRYHYWEDSVVLQATDTNTHFPWIVMTPAAQELFVGHWQFELDVFNTGTAPGQYPPVFATGRVYDVNNAAADLLEFWAASYSADFDITTDGQSLRLSQLMTAKMALAEMYRKRSGPKIVKMVRNDVMVPMSTRKMRLLDQDDVIKGA